jgi:hypothetical protein
MNEFNKMKNTGCKLLVINDKVYSILNIVLSILENTISGSESTCNSINGQLSGLSFNDGGRIVTEPKSKH